MKNGRNVDSFVISVFRRDDRAGVTHLRLSVPVHFERGTSQAVAYAREIFRASALHYFVLCLDLTVEDDSLSREE